MKPITQQAHELLATYSRGSLAIDATAGNGHDTLYLANLVGPTGTVWAFDIQPEALCRTTARLEGQQISVQLRLKSGPPLPTTDVCHRVIAIEADHAEMVLYLPPQIRGRVAAIMFNLGYLPGADKECITTTSSTLTALDAAIMLLAPGGVLTVVVYPGHPGGREEADAVRSWFQQRAGESSVRLLPNGGAVTNAGPQLLALQSAIASDSDSRRALGD